MTKQEFVNKYIYGIGNDALTDNQESIDMSNDLDKYVTEQLRQVLGSRPEISYNDFIKLFGTKKPKKYDLQSDIERLVKKAKKQGIKVVVTFEND